MRKSVRLAPDVGALALHAADGLVVRHEKIERMPMRSGKAVCAERMEQRSLEVLGAPKDPVVAYRLGQPRALGRRDG
jgi:hypothetical protein